MAAEKPETAAAPLTGVRTFHDVIRHLVTHGPARNPAEQAELVAVVDDADPDTDSEPEEKPGA